MYVICFSEKSGYLTPARCRNPQNDYHFINNCCWNLNPCFMYLSKGNINVICIVGTWWAKSHAPYRLRGCVTIEPTDIHVTLGISSEPADSTEMTSSHLIVPSAKGSPTSVENNGSLPYSQQPTYEKSDSDLSLSNTSSLNPFQ